MILQLYSVKCDEPLCRIDADLCGVSIAAVEKKLVAIGQWSIERQAEASGSQTRHYCPRCSRRRAEQRKLDDLIRSL